MKRAQKVSTCVIALAGLLVLLVSGYAARNVVWEQICLWRLESKDNMTRAWACYHLGRLRSVRSIPLLLQELGVPAEKVSIDSLYPRDFEGFREAAERGVAHNWAAAHALGSIGKPAVPDLIRALKQGDERVQYFAIRALADAGPDAKEAVPSLLEQLQHSEETHHRYAAADALGRIGVADDSVIGGLVHALRDKQKWVRTHSAEALRMLGPAASAAVPDLRVTLDDPEEIVRTNAAIALIRIGVRPRPTDPLVPILTSACRGSIHARAAGEALQMLQGPGAY